MRQGGDKSVTEMGELSKADFTDKRENVKTEKRGQREENMEI